MLQRERNSLQINDWMLEQIYPDTNPGILDSFDCGNPDLNDYFRNDAMRNKDALVGQPYFLYHADDDYHTPVALLDLCNDAVRKNGSKQQPGYLEAAEIESEKQFAFLPAVKITRFGVNLPFQKIGIGSNSLNMVKVLFITDNRTGCRFLTVDAYNRPETLNFYLKNEFKFFTEKDKDKNTRAMFFDLRRFVVPVTLDLAIPATYPGQS